MPSALVVLLALLAAVACGDDPARIDLPGQGGGLLGAQVEPVVDAGADRVAECDEAPEGTPCGEPGQRKHCLFDACVRNACGDAVAAFGEGCDDGNERDGDGCDARCELEVPPGCGNGVVEPGEQCDDGNGSDDDRCTAHCKDARCGDGVVSRGEQCDDGNALEGDGCTAHCQDPSSLCGNGSVDPGEQCDDADAIGDDECANDCRLPLVCGDGVMDQGESCDDGNTSDGDDCASDCSAVTLDAGVDDDEEPGPDAGSDAGGGGGEGGSAGGEAGSGGTEYVRDASCDACRAASCTNYLEAVDAVAGCLDATATGDAARAVIDVTFTPAQVQTCVDMVDCGFAHDCAYDPVHPVSPCYCGSRSLDDCNTMGPAADAPCIPEVQAACGTTVHADIVQRLSNASYPSGWANFLLTCEGTYCDDSALGDCTPN